MAKKKTDELNNEITPQEAEAVDTAAETVNVTKTEDTVADDATVVSDTDKDESTDANTDESTDANEDVKVEAEDSNILTEADLEAEPADESLIEEPDIRDLYYDYTDRINGIEENRYFKYLFEMVRAGENSFNQTNQVMHKVIDESWLQTIEESLDAINRIINKPRKFIKSVEEVVPVGLAKKITADSVKHLSKHTEFISSEPGEDIHPSKILNVSLEETYDLYENRFIYWLIQRLVRFIDKRTDVIFWATGDEKRNKLIFNSKVDDAYEQIEYKLEMTIKNLTSFADNDADNMEVFARIDHVRRLVMSIKASSFCTIMNGCSVVRSPIQRTNLMIKDPDYRTCYRLWQFLENYDDVGYTIEIREDAMAFDQEYVDQMYNNLVNNYTVFKSLIEEDERVLSDKLRETLELAASQREMKPKFIKEIREEIVESRDVPDVEIKRVFVEEVTEAQVEAEKRAEEAIKAMEEAQAAQAEAEHKMVLAQHEAEDAVSRAAEAEKDTEKALQKISELEKKVADTEAARQTTIVESEKEIERIKEAAAYHIEQARKESEDYLEHERSLMDSKIAAAVKEATAAAEQSKAEAIALAAKTKADAEAMVAQMREETDAEITRIQTDTDAEITRIQTDTDAEIARIKSETEDAIAQNNADTTAAIDKIKSETAETIATVKTDAETAIAKAQSDAETAIAKAQTDADAAIARNMAETLAMIEKNNAETASAIEQARDEARAAVEQVQADAKAQVDKHWADADAEIAKTKAEAEAAVNKAQTDAADAKAEAERTVATAKATADKLSADAKEKLELASSNLAEAREKEAFAKQTRIDTDKELKAQKQEVKTANEERNQMSRRADRLEKKIASMERSKEVDDKSNQKRISAMQADIAKAKAALEAEKKLRKDSAKEAQKAVADLEALRRQMAKELESARKQAENYKAQYEKLAAETNTDKDGSVKESIISKWLKR